MDWSTIVSSAINFPFTLDNDGVLVTTPNANKIYLDRVLTLLSTNVGQRPMLPEYGIDWTVALFENEDDARAATPGALTAAISRWIPDVRVTNITMQDQQDGIEYVNIELVLPDNTVATLPINTATFNLDGTVIR
jgi:phage baseplate assembly protein W